MLVGYLGGDPEPVGIARLVRDGRAAEVAFAVADAYQGRGIGTILTRELAADARAPGSPSCWRPSAATTSQAVSLLARVSQSLQVRWRGGERELVARLGSSTPPGTSGATVSRLIRPCRSRCLWPSARAGPSG